MGLKILVSFHRRFPFKQSVTCKSLFADLIHCGCHMDEFKFAISIVTLHCIKMFVVFLGHHSLSVSRYPPYSSSPSPHTLHSPSGHRSMRPKPSCVDVGTNTSLPGCVNGRSPDLPANPVTWSVEQVVRYVRSTDCINYANIFLDQVNLRSFRVMVFYKMFPYYFSTIRHPCIYSCPFIIALTTFFLSLAFSNPFQATDIVMVL